MLDLIHKINYDIDIFVKLNWFKAPKFQEIEAKLEKSERQWPLDFDV